MSRSGLSLACPSPPDRSGWATQMHPHAGDGRGGLVVLSCVRGPGTLERCFDDARMSPEPVPAGQPRTNLVLRGAGTDKEPYKRLMPLQRCEIARATQRNGGQ